LTGLLYYDNVLKSKLSRSKSRPPPKLLRPPKLRLSKFSSSGSGSSNFGSYFGFDDLFNLSNSYTSKGIAVGGGHHCWTYGSSTFCLISLTFSTS